MAKPSIAKQSRLTQERLKELFHYDPLSGIFTRLVNTGRHGRYKAGTVAGSYTERGYLVVVIESKIFSLHRLAWLYMTGEWPLAGVDHGNGVHDDNRFENLRPAEQWQNAQNNKIPVTNTSGLIGASWHKGKKKWCAGIGANRKRHYLGAFDTAEEAHAAYLSAKASLHTFQPTVRAA